MYRPLQCFEWLRYGNDLYFGLCTCNKRIKVLKYPKDTSKNITHLIFSSLHLQYHSLHTCIPLILALSMMLLVCF